MKKNNKTLKRFLAFLLCAAMLITYMPSSVYTLADESADTPEVAADSGDSGSEAKKDAPKKSEAPAAAPAEQAESAPAAEPEAAAEPEESQVEEAQEPETPETRAGPSDDSDATAEEATEETSEEAVPADEEAVKEEAVEEEKEDEEKLNEKELTFTGKANSVNVKVVAQPGTFPEGTTMKVVSVAKSEVKDAVEGALDDVNDFRAVDITFYADGKEVQPKKNVSVKLTTYAFDSEEDLNVVHVKDSGNAEVMGLSSATDTAAQFKSDSFSVYVVVETGDNARLVVKFMNGNTLIDSIYVKKDDNMQQVLYDPGTGDLADGAYFRGWTTEANYTEDTAALSIADVRTQVNGLLPPSEDGKEVTYYAMVFKDYRITYLDEHDISLGQEEKTFRADNGSTEQDYTVNMGYTVQDDTHHFEGWNVVEGGSNIVGHSSGKIYQNNDAIKITGDVTFGVNAPEGHWFIFDENGGGTYNAPQFVYSSATPNRPNDSNMRRNGFTFGGWFTDKSVADQTSGGTQYNFNQTLTDKVTVYARWIPNTTANYTVLIWKQNLDADGYDFEEAITLSGNVGTNVNSVSQQGSGNNAYARINGTNYQYEGFHLDHFDQNVSIKTEGNSVVNVYYNRTSYTLTFRRYENSGTVYDTITALYGQYIGDHFPISVNGDTTYRWSPHNSSTYNQVLVYIDIMPAENITFSRSDSDASTKYMEFYVEALPGQTADRTWSGKNFVKYGNTIPAKYNWFTEAEDFLELTGYEKYGSDPAFGNNGRAYVDGGGTIRFYYTRKVYKINFMDGKYFDGDGNKLNHSDMGQIHEEDDILYQADISSFNDYEPSNAPSGYVFNGWYVDSDCSHPFTFETMPEGGITVYAKWVQKQYRVFLHPNYPDGATGNIDWGTANQAMSFRLNAGDHVSEPTGRLAGYEFVGWYLDPGCTQVFNGEAYVINDSTVNTPYDQSADMTDTYDNNGNLVSPIFNSDAQKNRFWITTKLDIYAKWRSTLDGASGIVVEYDANGGTKAPTDTHTYVDGAEAPAGAASKPKDDTEVFKHWVVQKWNGTKWVDTSDTVLPGKTFTILARNAKVEDITNPPAGGDTKKYTVRLRAEYLPSEQPTPTHINWYKNDGTSETYRVDDPIGINDAVKIYGLGTGESIPSREGYTFKGWAKSADATTPWITYNGEGGYTYGGKSATEVAADEGQPYDDMYAIWEAADVNYNVKYYYEKSGDEGYDEETATPVRTAKTGSTVEVTTEDTSRTKDGLYVFDAENTNNVLSDTVAGDGSTVLKVYYKLNTATVTVHYYLKGTETKVAEDKVTQEVIGTKYTAPDPTAFLKSFEGYSLTKDTTEPTQPVTVVKNGNTITVYYTLPLKITAKSDKKVYDGTALTNDGYDVGKNADGKSQLLAGDSITSVTVTGSQTLVGSSDNVAKDAVIKYAIEGANYYVISYDKGTLTVTDGTTPPDEPVDDDLVVTKADSDTTEGKTYKEGDTVTFKITATNIYSEARTITLSEIADVTLTKAVFENVAAGETVETTATYKITAADMAAGSFKNTVTAAIGDNLTKTADATVNTAEIAASLKVTKTADKTSGVKAGETVTYTITVENTGNATVNSLVLTDPLKDIQLGTLDKTTIAPKEKATATATYVVKQTDVDAGEINNTATVKGKDPKNVEVTGSDSEKVTTVEAAPAIKVTKAADKTSGVKAGDTVTYTITVENTGNVTVSSLAVTDVLAGIQLGKFDKTTIAPKEKATATATYVVKQSDVDAGEINNTATATGKDPKNEDVSGNASAKVTTEAAAGSIKVTKTADKTSGVKVGDTVTYTITVENTGNVTVKSLALTDILKDIQLGALDKTTIAPKEKATATATYVVKQADVDAGEINNTATATGKDPKNADVTGEASAKVTTVEADAALTVTKEADKTSGVKVGDKINYTVTVKNTGNVTVSGIAVSDTLVKLNEKAFDLAPGANKEIKYTYTVTQDNVDAGKIDNTVTAKGKDPKDADVTGTASATVTAVTAAPALTVTKTADKTSGVKVGDKITYTVTVENTGNVTVKGIELDDTLVTLSEEAFDLAPGAKKEGVTYTYTVTQSDVDAGKIDNTVTATGKDPKGNDVIEDATATVTTVEADAKIKVTKTADKTSGVKAGETVTYTITVENTGNVTVQSLALTDALKDIQLGALDKTTIAPKEKATATATYVVKQSDVDAGEINNTATATGKDPKNADVTGEASAKVTTEEGAPALSVTKVADKTKDAKVGDEIKYTVTVKNTGNVTVSGIAMSDTLVKLNEKAFDLAPGEEQEIKYTYAVTQADVDAGSFINTVTAKGKNPKGEEVSQTASATVTTEAAAPALTVVKTADKESDVKVGDKITYTVTVTNTGNVTVSEIAMSDTLVKLNEKAFDLAPGAKKEITYTYTVTQADIDAGVIENTAAATGKDPKNTPVKASDDFEVTAEEANADLTVTKTHKIESTGIVDAIENAVSDQYKVGDTITYTIVVENTGNVTITGLKVEDVLDGAQVGTLDKTEIAPGEKATITATYVVTQADVDAGKIENTATATGEDPKGNEITGSGDDEIESEKHDPKLTVDKTANPDKDVKVGDTIAYTVVVKNEGNVTIKDIEVADEKMPPQEKFSLAPGKNKTITYTYTVTQADFDAGKVVNAATAKGKDPDDKTPEGEKEIEVPAAETNAKLSITKKASKTAAVNAGDEITYTVVVKNIGDVSVKDGVVTDEHAGETKFESFNLAPGEEKTYSYKYTVTQDDIDGGSFTNTAKANATAVRGKDPAEVEASATVTASDADAALEITKTADKTSGVKVGDTVTYTIEVKNAGNVTVNNVQVDEQLAGVEKGELSKTTLKPGETATLTATYVVKQADVDKGEIVNVATANATAVRGDNPDEVTASATVKTEKMNAKYTAVKTVTSEGTGDNGTYKAGEPVDYQIVVTNTGNVTLSNIKVEDKLDAPANADAKVTFGDMPEGATLNGDNSISIAKMAPGESLTFTATYVVTQDDVDAQKTITNAVAATASNPQDDKKVEPDPSDPPKVDPEKKDPKYTVDKEVKSTGSAEGGKYKVNEKVEYWITVKNTGNVTLYNINVEDKLTAPGNSDAKVTFTDRAGGKLNSDNSVTLEKLEVGATAVLKAEYTITQADIDAQKTITNVATAKAKDPDEEEVDPKDPTPVPVDPEKKNPDYTVVKSVASTGSAAGGKYKAGETVRYEIVVTNTGNVTLSNITVEDKLTNESNPGAKVTFTDLAGGTKNSDNTVTLKTLAVGKSVKLKAEYTITQADVDAQKAITNVATAKAKDPDEEEVDPKDPTPVPVTPETARAAISVTKSANRTRGLRQGDTVRYTITVRNTGNVTLTGINVTDSLVKFKGSKGKNITLAPGASAKLTYNYTVTAANVRAGRVVNTATAQGSAPNGSRPSDSDSVTARTRANGGGGGNPGRRNPAGPAPGGPAVTPAAPADGAAVVVPEEPVPEAEPEVEIEESETPLAAGAWALVNLICAVVTALGAIVALFRKKEDDDEDEDEPKTDEEDEDDNRGKKMLASKIAGTVAGVAGPVAFILTEDMSLPMQMVDKWTLLMVVILAAQIVAAIFNKKASELDDEDEEEAAAN